MTYQLPESFKGRVIRNGDPAYEESRRAWNDMYLSRPAEIILCADDSDVQAAVRHARSRATPFRVRSGGHSIDGLSSVDDGIVIDLSMMHDIELGKDGLVRLQPAARTTQIVDALHPYKRAVPGGACTNVAAGGYCLGGGMGMLSRTYGLAAQNIVEMEIVNADGELITLSKDSYPDLFWACRGAGNGNFGVITSITMHTYEVDDVVFFDIRWPWALLSEVYPVWQDWMLESDPRINSFFTFQPKSAGWVDVGGILLGTQDELPPMLREILRECPIPDETLIQTIPYTEYVQRTAHKVGTNEFHKHSRATALQLYSAPLDGDAVKILEEHHEIAFGNTWSWLHSYSASSRRLDSEDVDIPATPPGDLVLNIRGDWTNPVHDEKYVEWFRSINEALETYTLGTYHNWTNMSLEPRPYRHYWDHLPRLMEIKRKYDPADVFHTPGGVPLTISEREVLDWKLPPNLVDKLRANGSVQP